MAETKDNNTWNVVRTIFSALTTAFVIGCFKYLWAINNFMIATTIKDQRQDEIISQFIIDFDLQKKQQEKNRNDIAELEAILPNEKKQRKTHDTNE